MDLKYLRYYEGDVSGDDPLWSDPKAYVTLNALLFPGLQTEVARVKEKRRLNPAFLQRPKEVKEILEGIACWFDRKAADHPDLHVSRVERLADYQVMKTTGLLPSFISTSTGGFLNAYQDKEGLVLMNICIPHGVPCLDFAALMREGYEKADEKEILLPPYLSVSFQEKTDLSAYEKITDRNGSPPAAVCDVSLSLCPFRKIPETEIPECDEEIYALLNAGKPLSPSQLEAYMRLKEGFRNAVRRVLEAALSGSGSDRK